MIGTYMIGTDNVCWRVSGNDIVRDISLTVRRGETFGLVGPNGSGKSTLLRLIAGVLKPARGGILLDGTPIQDLSRRRIAQLVAFVAQHAQTAERFTVRDVVELGRTPWLSLMAPFSEEDRRIVDRHLATVDMGEMSDRIWATLSGGERQRVLLARALAQEPQVLLLDEPTNHLDIHHQLSILRLVRAQAVTSVIALHDLNQAMECDRVGVLSDGCLVACGSPEDVLTPKLLDRVFDVRSSFLSDPEDGRRLIRFSL